MGTVSATVRRRILAGAFVASLAFALIAPAAAFAANTASFSSRTPASGAKLTSTRPSVSVTVYDRYGIHGSGAYSIVIDGKSYKPSVTYIVKGSWNPSHPDYRRLRLSYRMTKDLKPGSHRITVKVRDLKRRSSSTSWSFSIKGPEPAYTASFSSPAPAAGSKSTALRPTVSLTGYDKYGVEGSANCTMTFDGAPVTPVVSYTSSGAYTSFKVTYPLPSDLSIGTHSVRVGVVDVKGNPSSYAWSFTTLETPLVPMPVSGTACVDCHAGYPATHPMGNCQACHSASAPRNASGEAMNAYTPADKSAHTLSCAVSRCHRGGGTFPHTLDADCTRCHTTTGAFPGVPAAHPLDVEEVHISSSQSCVKAGCHVASLTLEHYRRVTNGTHLSCATCHSSTDPKVRAAIDAKSAACEGCHGSSGHLSEHDVVRNDGCAGATCHPASNANLTTIHEDCATCHESTDPVVVLAIDRSHTACASCHTFTNHTALHAVVRTDGCAGADCHSASLNLTTLHPACATCHESTRAAVIAAIDRGDKACASCHAFTTHTSQHEVTRTDSCAGADCHVSDTNLTTIHDDCATCHKSTDPAVIQAISDGSKACASCHAFTSHVLQHAVTRTDSCAGGGCHLAANANLTTLHEDCATCHDSADTKVIAAISDGDKTCTACHDFANHTAKHELLRTDTCVGSSCHPASLTNLTAIHTGCAVCHDSEDTVVTSAIADHHTACASCHPFANHSAQHEVVRGDSCAGVQCHPSNDTNLMTIHEDCAQCHDSTKPEVIAAIDGHDKACATCHGAGDHYAKHEVPRTDSCVGAACHAASDTNLTKLHADCSTCHDSTDPLVVAAIATGATPGSPIVCGTCHTKTIPVLHARSESSHTAWNPTCVSVEPCHGSNVAAIHGAPYPDGSAGPNCAACHRDGHTPSLICSDCHKDETAPKHASIAGRHTSTTGACVTTDCHVADITAIHAADYADGRTGPSCAACHAEGRTASNDCTSCHGSDPAVAHAPGDRPHTAGAGYCVQGGCHISNVVTLHTAPRTGGLKAPGCVACHGPDQPLTVACVACHSGTSLVVHSRGSATHQSASGQCVNAACHEPHSSNVVPLHNSNKCYRCHAAGVEPSVVCADCHRGSDAPLHASADASHTAPVGACVNPYCHNTKVSTMHDAQRPGKTAPSCAACHTRGGTPPTLVCTTCHTTDPLLFHEGGAALHLVPTGSCVKSDCHGADVTAVHSKTRPDGTPGPSCAACHRGDRAPSFDCSSCHGADTAVVHAAGDTIHTTTSFSCIRTGCHVANVVTLHTTGRHKPGCSACHANPDHSASVLCADCHTGTSQTVHTPYVGTAHNTPSVSCTSRGDCHIGSVVSIHTPAYPDGRPGPSCAACHADGVAPTVDCATCHMGDLTPRHSDADSSHTVAAGSGCATNSPCHSTNVATIHAQPYSDGRPGPRCEACHAIGKTPSLVCANCHNGGFTTAHPAPVEAHTAPAVEDAECLPCHTGNVATLHTTPTTSRPVPVGCVACHGNPDHDASLVCSTCHFERFVDHPAPDAPHRASSNGCTACHGDQVAILHAKAYSDGRPGPGCAACHGGTKVPATACATCHVAGTYHSKAALKHDVTATGCTGTSAGCHPADVSVTHAPTTNSCQNCHATTPTAVCASCHATHHTRASAKHAVAATGCSVAGCHKTDASEIHYKNSTYRCQACHAAGVDAAVKGTTCATCHPAADHTSSHSDCNGCHNGDHYGGPTVGVSDCASCHGSGVHTWYHPGTCHGCMSGAAYTVSW